ncbi:MAG: hypothetical protein US11_C0006G0028 [Candidatus Roizmanbacteria bacterium GW2011_GWA2_36_23]|uniref:Uncharacterized protein n=1 Tax=Candidatus Roizmanbacteria bacterium GW2011_GWA2_36_23 TaxID=1618480 RepID=A0A0G0HCF8_9BACT|nr:MAG: hypothetical protein US11_C0006G0028 [Candidatus Roizmanbacteria bacterium GW2011_GWA2_36_23]
MIKNFTPFNIETLQKKDSTLNTALLIIAVITTAVLAILLYILIQKKINLSKPAVTIYPTPTSIVVQTPFPIANPSVITSPSVLLDNDFQLGTQGAAPNLDR